VDGVVDKYGVPPELIIDYLALMGDSVDNIPGVPKVGPKTAAKWLNEYGSLDAIMAQADDIKGKVGENLRNSLEQLPLSRELTAIKCDVELEVGVEDLAQSDPDTESLLRYFTDLEFKSWRQELESGDLTLDDALKKFEEGIKLSRFCSKKLDETEKKVSILLKDETGEVKSELFSLTADDPERE